MDSILNIDEFLQKYFTLNVDKTFYYTDKLVEEKDFLDYSNISDLESLLRTDNSEHEDILNRSCYLTAPLGSGKTYSIIKLAHTKKIPLVMSVPLTALGNQKQKEFKKDGIKILFVQGGNDKLNIAGTSDAEISNFLKGKNNFVIICVYDSLNKLLSNSSFRNRVSEFVLVIDESHNLITQANFRYRAIYAVQQSSRLFRKVVYLTATPEMTILPNNQLPLVKFEKSTSYLSSAIINIIAYKPERVEQDGKEKLVNPKNTIYMIATHMYLNRDVNSKTILVWDSKNDLKEIEKGLRIYGINKNEILLINADEKSSDDYLYLLEYEHFPAHIKFILSTRLISDGVNLKDEDVSNVYFVGVNDVFMKRQFIGRFRKSTPNIYDMISINSYQNQSVSTLYEDEDRKIQEDQSKCDRLNELGPTRARRSEFYKSSRFYNINNCEQSIGYTEETGFFVRLERHRFDTLQIASNFIHNNPQNLKTFYESIGFTNISVVDHTQLFKDVTQQSKYKISTFNRHRSLIDCVNVKDAGEFNLHFDKLLTMHYGINGSTNLMPHVSLSFRAKGIDNKFIENNKALVQNNKELFSRLTFFLNLGLDYYFIKEYSRIYFNKDASVESHLDKFFKVLTYYIEYCCLIKFTHFRPMVEKYSGTSLSRKKAILQISELPPGDYNKTALKKNVMEILSQNKLAIKETSVQYLIDSILEVEYPKRKYNSGSKAILIGTRKPYDPTAIIDHLQLFNKFNELTKSRIVSRWEKIIHFAGYYHFELVRYDVSKTTEYESFASEYSKYIDDFRKELESVSRL